VVDYLLSFKILICFGFLFILASCGVKGPPIQYPETVVDSYIKSYTGKELSAEEIELSKDKSSIPSSIEQQQQKPLTRP
jgi:predicted small lipoprotein YifL